MIKLTRSGQGTKSHFDWRKTLQIPSRFIVSWSMSCGLGQYTSRTVQSSQFWSVTAYLEFHSSESKSVLTVALKMPISTGNTSSSSVNSIVWTWVLMKPQTGRTGSTCGTVQNWVAMDWRRIGTSVSDSGSIVGLRITNSAVKPSFSLVNSIIRSWIMLELQYGHPGGTCGTVQKCIAMT